MLFSLRSSHCVAACAISAGVALFGAVPSALADPPPPPAPGCSAGDFEQVTAEVAAATSAYFFTHPDANAFFSTLKGQPRDQVRSEVRTYLTTTRKRNPTSKGSANPYAI